MRNTSPVFFLCNIFSFGVRVMLPSQNELKNTPSSSIFWKCLCTIGIIFSLNIWYNLPVQPSECDVSFVGRFLATISMSLIIMLFGLLLVLALVVCIYLSCGIN